MVMALRRRARLRSRIPELKRAFFAWINDVDPESVAVHSGHHAYTYKDLRSEIENETPFGVSFLLTMNRRMKQRF